MILSIFWRVAVTVTMVPVMLATALLDMMSHFLYSPYCSVLVIWMILVVSLRNVIVLDRFFPVGFFCILGSVFAELILRYVPTTLFVRRARSAVRLFIGICVPPALMSINHIHELKHLPGTILKLRWKYAFGILPYNIIIIAVLIVILCGVAFIASNVILDNMSKSTSLSVPDWRIVRDHVEEQEESAENQVGPEPDVEFSLTRTIAKVYRRLMGYSTRRAVLDRP